MYQVIPLYVLYHGFAYMHFLYLIVSNLNVEERKWGQYYHRYHFNICNDCVRTACVRVGECIVDDRHNKQAWKDRLRHSKDIWIFVQKFTVQ
jgi:hypothetical protein